MLVGLALLYKTIVEWERKIKEYRQLKILGYSKEEIINIIYKENILFFGNIDDENIKNELYG
jgi:hypothetical protein